MVFVIQMFIYFLKQYNIPEVMQFDRLRHKHALKRERNEVLTSVVISVSGIETALTFRVEVIPETGKKEGLSYA